MKHAGGDGSGIYRPVSNEPESREPAYKRVDPAIKEKALELALAEYEADCARHFPHGAVLDVKVSDGELFVVAGGEDVSGRARQVVRIAISTLREIGEPTPVVLTPRDVIALMGLELHHDPGALMLKD